MFLQFADLMTNGMSAVTALAVICLLQYVSHVVYRREHDRTTKRSQEDLTALETDLQVISRERTAARIESQILREILSQTDFSRAMSFMLKRFVPAPSDGFAALIPLDQAAELTSQTRWLSESSSRRLQLDPDWDEALRAGTPLVIEGARLARSPFLTQLDPLDRRKAQRLFVVGAGAGDDLCAALVTTSLLPAPLSRPELLELTQRLMNCVAGKLRQTLQLEKQSDQLRCTREMLELRAIADGPFDQPLRMMERFLQRLGHQLNAERTALYVYNRDQQQEPRNLLRCGIQLQPNVAARWQQHEDAVVLAGNQAKAPLIFGRERLLLSGIETLIGSAMTVPLIQNDRFLGMLCLTRRDQSPLSPSQIELATWAGETLGETIQRIFNYATIERQARHDGLTDLANRRTFDLQIQREISNVNEGALMECSLLLLDLDHFKKVNDTHGHQAGDEVLKETARRLKQEVAHVRAADRPLLARYGGEEMAVLLPGVGIAGALRIGEAIRQAIATAPFAISPTERIHVTASIGVASAPLHAQTSTDMIEAADHALYQAKNDGRNCVVQAQELGHAHA